MFSSFNKSFCFSEKLLIAYFWWFSMNIKNLKEIFLLFTQFFKKCVKVAIEKMEMYCYIKQKDLKQEN